MTPKFDLPAWLAVPRFGVRSRGTAPYRHPVVALLLGLVLIGLSYLSIPETGQIWAAPSQSPDTATAGKVVDLQVSKIVSNPAPQEGDVVTYTVTVTNFGFQNATEVVISDTLALNLTLIRWQATRGEYIGNLWEIGRLKEGEMARLTLAVKIGSGTSGKTITNTAAIFTSQPYAEDEDQAVVTVSGLDVAVAKTVNDKTPANRETITYTVIVTNYGPGTATGVRLDEAWPAEVIPGGYTATQGSYSDVSQDWEVGSLAEGATAALKLNGMVRDCTGGKTISNTVTLSAIDQRDENEENNQANVEIVSQSYCLYLPVVFKDYCSGTYVADDFSEPNTGWITGTYIEGDYAYVPATFPDEYQVYAVQKNTRPTARSASPYGSFNRYTVKVDIAWSDFPLGDEYGILFGIKGKNDKRVTQAAYLYRFVINTRKNREFSLRRFDGQEWFPIADWTIRNQQIYENLKSNTLLISCDDKHAALFANGNILWQGKLPTSCSGEVGVTSSIAFPETPADARFDNFEICGETEQKWSHVSNLGVIIPSDTKSHPND